MIPTNLSFIFFRLRLQKITSHSALNPLRFHLSLIPCFVYYLLFISLYKLLNIERCNIFCKSFLFNKKT